ncbi:hypothetical protein ACF1CG_17400 [Streptomyces sp. NPDC014773]|uniref:hypothetical protein n=1 Tax=Streptomyces sp. NPDC014773 TaxID=3364908 RepID=UPI0036F8B126
MHHSRTTRIRLSTAVAAAVLAGATIGALGGPAVAAAPVAVTAQEGTAFPFPLGVVQSAGPTGFLADRTAEVVWTRYADGAATTFPKGEGVSFRGATGADVVVRSEGARHTVHDMAGGGDPVVIDTPASYELREVVGSTLVMVDENTKELHLVSRTPGAGRVDRTVGGLGTGAVPWYFYGSTPGTLLMETSTKSGEFRLLLIDVATAAVFESYALTSHSGYAQVTPGRVLFGTGYDQTRVVDRTTKQGVTYPYAARFALGGDWLAVIGGPSPESKVVVDGVTYPNRPVVLKSLEDDRKVPLLDLASRVEQTGDGSLLVEGGTYAEGRGLFRVALDASGTPTATMVADRQKALALVIEKANVPSVFRFDGSDPLVSWETSTPSGVSLELTHVATGRKVTLWSNLDASIRWDGRLDQQIGAHNGAYTWTLRAYAGNGLPNAEKTGTTTVQRAGAPRDFNDNGGADALVRDSAGNVSAYDISQLLAMKDHDCHEEGCPPLPVTDPEGDVLGTGWNTYTLMAAPSDRTVVGRDRDGVLWTHRSEKQKLLPRTKVGGGWQVYNKIVGGSDLNGDGRGDLLATDTSGVLWFYASTGDTAKPFKTRVKVGGGWQTYNLLTAPGNVAGATGGDLLARDASGVLWLYLGKGDGTFTARRQIGGGWQKYSHVIPAGLNSKGVADLYAVGAAGSAHYSGTNSTTRPFGAAHTLPLRTDSTRFKTFF